MARSALPRLLTTAQVAEVLGEHPETTADRIRRGQIPAIRLASTTTGRLARNAPIRVRDTDLADFISAQQPANRTAS